MWTHTGEIWLKIRISPFYSFQCSDLGNSVDTAEHADFYRSRQFFLFSDILRCTENEERKFRRKNDLNIYFFRWYFLSRRLKKPITFFSSTMVRAHVRHGVCFDLFSSDLYVGAIINNNVFFWFGSRFQAAATRPKIKQYRSKFVSKRMAARQTDSCTLSHSEMFQLSKHEFHFSFPSNWNIMVAHLWMFLSSRYNYF